MIRLFLPLLVMFPAVMTASVAAASPLSSVRQLTFEGARAGEGYFSADGTKMVFQSEREPENPFYQIYLMDLETGDVDLVSPGIGKTTCAWIAPGGDRVLYASTQFDPAAEEKMQAEIDFRASGQTRRYAWDYDETYDLIEKDLASGAFKRLTDAKGYDAEGSYSPEGSKILFASNRAAYAGPLSEAEAEILARDPSYFMDLYVMNADGTGVTRLTDAPGYDGGPFWSADGSRITWRRFSEDGARAEIFVADADGANARQITELGVLSWAPYYHPSGDYLIFATNLQGFANFELYLVDAAGAKAPVRITEREGFDGLPVFSPDGARLAWTSNDTAGKKSQIFTGAWDDAAARALLAAAPDRQAAAAPDATDGTSPEIAAADLRVHVEALASDEMEGRLTGAEGGRKATAYVAEVFAALGLAPAGDDGAMFQSFDFTAGVDLGEGNALTVSVDGAPEALALSDAWTPLAFSKPGAVAEAPVAFAGYGLVAPEEGEQAALDSYGDLDVEGKWALIWRGMPGDLSPERRTWLARFADLRYKASVARSRGAIGVIFAPPLRDGFEDALPRLAYEATSGAASMPAVAVDRAAMRRMLSILGDDLDALAAAAEAGETASTDLIGVAAAAEIALAFETRTGRNVIARLDLGGAGRPPLVIGAHVDHLGRGETSGSLASGEEAGGVHHGADDNASGVAALIEVAQKLAAMKAEGGLAGGRDVIFAAWSGEELGLLGAHHFAGAMAEAAGAETLAGLVSAYINMDMVGRLRDRVIVGGLGSSPAWAREVERRNAVIGLPIVTNSDPYLPTDSTAFYLRKVPILSIFTGAHEDYHKPSDTAEKLNYEGLEDIARFVALVARSRTLAEDEPEFVEVARPTGGGGRRMSGVFLGTIPDYAQEGVEGVKLSGVVKDGPAEAAGVQGGDVLVELAGQDLANIYDFVRALNGLKPGEEVGVAVMRGGERVEMRVTPGTRN